MARFQAKTSHQFPIQETVFPPLQLSESAKEVFSKTALAQLTRALREYDKFQKWQASQPPNGRYQLHPAIWKPIKTCEQLTVYRQIPSADAIPTTPAKWLGRRAYNRTLEAMRVAAAAATTGANSVFVARKDYSSDRKASSVSTQGSEGAAVNSEWTAPTLLQVGVIEGTLDDVMYGLTTFDAVGTLIRSFYMTDEVLDADTLCEIQSPTPTKPFRFLGLKWIVKSTSTAVTAFVRPRDLTYIAATGILNRHGGERVGYQLMHSVDLGKGYGPLERKQIVRGRVSSYYLFRQTSENTVDVYMKTHFEPNGIVHENVALLAAANHLTHCLKFALCAQNKKLSWLLLHPKTDEIEARSARSSTIYVKNRNDCGVCTRSIGTFSQGYSCRVCNARACSTCSVKRKLVFSGKGPKTLEQRSVVICTHCLTRARKLASLDIAKQEAAERTCSDRQRGIHREIEASSCRNHSNSRSNMNKLRRGTICGWVTYNCEREQEKIEAKHCLFANSKRKMSTTQGQMNFRTMVESNPTSSWAETDDDDNAVECSSKTRLPFESQPSTPEMMAVNSTRWGTNTPMSEATLSIASQQDIWDTDSKWEDKYDYGHLVASSQAMPLDPEVAILKNSLPDAVVQYTWGEIVPSPTNQQPLESLAAWPVSPLPSITPFPNDTEVTWSTFKGEQAMMQPPPIPPSTIPHIQAGASTAEVLARFAELCNAAENAYRASRKHTIAHLEKPTVQSNTPRFDMSAVD